MKSNKILSLAIASVLGVTSAQTMAAVDLNANTGAIEYASEIAVKTDDVPANVTYTTGMTAFSKIGVSLADISTLYVRYTLANGTFGAQLSTDNASVGCGASGATGVTSPMSYQQGGATTDNYVIYALPKATAGSTIASTCPVTLDLSVAGVKLTSATASPSLRYEVYETLAAAVNQTLSSRIVPSASGASVEGALLKFSPALKFKPEANYTNTAKVLDSYKKFKDSTVAPATTPTIAEIGKFSLGINKAGDGITDLLGAPDGGAVAIESVSQLLATTSSIVVTGDFSVLPKISGSYDKNSLYLSSDDCLLSAFPATEIVADAKSAKFTLGAPTLTAVDGDATYSVCYEVDGVTAIPESAYNVKLVGVSVNAAHYATSKLSTAELSLGTIKRDGVILRSGFISKNGVYGADGVRIGGQSRFILANTGSVDANVTDVKFYASTGDTVPTRKLEIPFPLKAGTRTYITMDQLVGNLASVPANFMVEFNIGADQDNIFGTYQLLLNGSTVQTVVPLERPVSAFK